MLGVAVDWHSLGSEGYRGYGSYQRHAKYDTIDCAIDYIFHLHLIYPPFLNIARTASAWASVAGEETLGGVRVRLTV